MEDRRGADRGGEDRLFREILRETATEKVPPGFSRSVMDRIRAEKAAAPTSPLISRAGWMALAAAFAGLLTWAIYTAGDAAGQGGALSRWMEQAAPNALPNWELPVWDLPEIPAATVYGAVCLMLFAGLQFAWMKQYLGRSSGHPR